MPKLGCASINKLFNVDQDKILRDPENIRLFQAMTRFAKLLQRLGYPVQIYSESSLQKIEQISAEDKMRLVSDFETWSEWVEPLNPLTPTENQMHLLKRALAKHGFEAHDEFLKTIEPDQIVEFYNEDMIQLYRSFNFFKISGYSLLDMSVFEWYLLWDRPRQIMKSISAELSDSLKTYIPVKRFATPRHVIREIYDTRNSKPFIPRTALAEFLHLGSLRTNKFTRNLKKGFICTSYGQLLAVGEESKTIDFI